jgi:23S rRNA A2030 N6-methylase RlmJ
MTQTALKKLRKKLPKKGSATISEKTGFSLTHVNMVLAGTRNNQTIIDCAIEVAADYQTELEETEKTIKAL